MDDKSISELLNQIDQLDQEATKGPWDATTSEATMNDRSLWRIGQTSKPQVSKSVMRTADAEFIALARTFTPAASRALRAVMEIHKPFHADHYYNGMDGESLHRFVLQCAGCHDSGAIEDYPCPTVQAITDAMEGDDD